MNNDIYSPPSAQLTEVDPNTPRAEFYVVSKKKFVILFLCTLGFYQLYWLYRNWKLQKIVTGLQVRPLLRTIFQLFFIHALFRRIDQRLRSNGKKFYWHPDSYATAIVALMIISNVADRLTSNPDMHPLLQVSPLLLVPLMAMAYLPAQEAINQCCNDPKGSANNNFTIANYAWIFAGVLFWLLCAVGVVAMFAEQGG